MSPRGKGAWAPRVVNGDQAVTTYPTLGPLLLGAIERCDPLADAVVAQRPSRPVIEAALRGDFSEAPEALQRFVQHNLTFPDWVDWSRVNRAGGLLFRSGPAGGIVLGAKSLVGGYCSPAGNKPLVFSGQLEKAVSRRVSETGRFVTRTCTAGALHPYQEGWRITLRVRLMHAQVRRLLEASGRWNGDAWGAPINQHDMVATTLLFSIVFVDGVRAFGERVTDEEAEDYLHLWRLSGWLMGVEDRLLPRSFAEARALLHIVEMTQGEPDDDSRRLTAALLNVPPPMRSLRTVQEDLGHGFCRHLVGDALADQLGVRKTPWARAIPSIRTLRKLEALLPARLETRRREWAQSRGRQYWAEQERMGTGGAIPQFPLPSRLTGMGTSDGRR